MPTNARSKVVTRKYDAYVVAAHANERLFGVGFGDGYGNERLDQYRGDGIHRRQHRELDCSIQ